MSERGERRLLTAEMKNEKLLFVGGVVDVGATKGLNDYGLSAPSNGRCFDPLVLNSMPHQQTPSIWHALEGPGK